MSQIEIAQEEEVKDQQIEIKEKEEVVQDDGLSPEELEQVEKLGLNKNADKKQSEPKTDENSGKQKEQEAEVEDKHPTFEDIEKDKSLLKKYNKNEQALYFKYKSDKRKRQEAEERLAEVQAQHELGGVKEKAYRDRIEKAVQLLKDENRELTAKEILAILDSQEAKEPIRQQDEKPEAQKKQEQFQKRVSFIEEMGREQHDDFDNLVELAKEVVQATPRYQKYFQTMLSDESIDSQEVIDAVVEMAQKNPKINKGKEAPKNEQEKVNRAIKNSEKKVSSASIGSGGGRIVSESELTLEDAVKLTTEQWRKLKPETRDRLSRL